MSDFAPIVPKLEKLVPRLASDVDGEVISTVRMIDRTLRSAGLDWFDLVAALHQPSAASPETDWLAVARWCQHNGAGTLSAKEETFVTEMVERLVLGGRPTRKQAIWLRAIHARLGGAA